MDAARDADEFRRQKTCLFEWVFFICCERPVTLNRLRALEGIKDKLEVLSEHSGAAGRAEKEEDRIVVCDLADDLRDDIVEYH